jgi:pimeloyl-ACP methyl ester carboxylesterase
MTALLFARREGSGPPLIILHGLFGSSRNWAAQARQLGERWRVSALDLRNHGNSPWRDNMSYPAMAGDVLHHLDTAGYPEVVLVGHSMGGKAAMALSLMAPERVSALVVVDMAPVAYTSRLDAYASGLDAYVEAMQAVDLSGITRRGEVDRALSEAVPDPNLRGFLLQNLVAEDGRFHWRLNLAVLGQEMASIMGFPEDLAAASYQGPVCFISGEQSPFVQPGHRALIASMFPKAEFAPIAGAGHWVHAEAPDAFMQSLTGFLDRH